MIQVAPECHCDAAFQARMVWTCPEICAIIKQRFFLERQSMSKTVRVDPMTRVEGHLAIDTRVDNGKVVEARVAGRMFRGFEQLLVARHPVDAARITQRICGICHEVHGIAASLALENLYGLTPPRNGQILRELILGLHLVTDHIFHFYQLTLPDYVDFSGLETYAGQDDRVNKISRMFRTSSGTFGHPPFADALKDQTLTIEMALGYAESIAVRKAAASGLASLGGKVPFCHAILPGGLTTGITSDRLMNYSNALERTSAFIRNSYLPQVLHLAGAFRAYFRIGAAHGNFYANGGFSLDDQPLFVPGVFRQGSGLETVQLGAIGEDAEATFSPDSREGNWHGKAYSWVKALTYAGRPMEVGPLARMIVNNDLRFQTLLKSFDPQAPKSSVMARILARAVEADHLCSYLFRLLPSYRLDEATISPPNLLAQPTGAGSGMSLAARGALNHLVEAVDGKVVRYRLQVPSAWNFGPTINDQPGTVEAALLGTELAGVSKSQDSGQGAMEIGRIVRSFDPCLACAIH